MNTINSMLNMNESYDNKPQQCESPSLLKTLKDRQRMYQDQLESVTKAIEALEKNPQVAEILELVARAR